MVSVKKSIEENRIKEKEQIKQIAQLDHRISTATDRSAILREQTNTALAEKEKSKLLLQSQLANLSEERFPHFNPFNHEFLQRSRVLGLIDSFTTKIDEDRKLSDENTAKLVVASLTEQIRNQRAKSFSRLFITL